MTTPNGIPGQAETNANSTDLRKEAALKRLRESMSEIPKKFGNSLDYIMMMAAPLCAMPEEKERMLNCLEGCLKACVEIQEKLQNAKNRCEAIIATEGKQQP